jgi:hypothetical protein
MNKNTLKIDDLVFPIKNAELLCKIFNKKAYWNINIDTFGKVIDGEEWVPRIYSEELYALSDIRSWKDLDGKKLEWDNCYIEDEGDYNASIYVFEHNEIYNSSIDIMHIAKQDFSVNWTARCDVNFNAKYSTNLDLKINTQCAFAGIMVVDDNISPSKALSLIKHYYPNDNYHLDNQQDRFVHPLFSPSE